MDNTGASSSKKMAQPNCKISTNLEFGNQDTDSIPPTTTKDEPQLPRELLTEIFNHLPDSQSLLRCRLVCRSWKEAVDSSPKLMRELTVAVYHPSLFLDLNSFARRVKAIRLCQALPSTKKELDNFFTCIGKTIEKVVFDFMLRYNGFFNLAHGKNLVNEVFLRCEALNEIEIVQSHFQLACGLDKLGDEVFQVASAKVKAITTDWLPEQANSSHNKVLETFLIRFGNLSTIRFTSYRDQRSLSLPIQAFQFIAKYIYKYPGILKRIYLPNSIGEDAISPAMQFSSVAESAKYLRVIFLASSHGIAINDRNLRCLLNKIIKFEATQALKLDTPKYFSNFSAVNVVYPPWDSLSEDFHRLALCTNIKEVFLGIIGTQNPAYNGTDLQFLNYFDCIERIRIYSSDSLVRIASVISVNNDRVLWDWTRYSSTLKQLTIQHHIFQANELESIVCTFPHLTHVEFEYTQGSGVNFIVALTKLDKLEEILLASIEDLVDETFTLPCEVATDLQQQGQVQSVPAIAAFKRLKRLEIKECSSLRDSCLIEGISKARSLQSVEVFNCMGITTVGFDSLLEHMEGLPTSRRNLRAFHRATRKSLE